MTMQSNYFHNATATPTGPNIQANPRTRDASKIKNLKYVSQKDNSGRLSLGTPTIRAYSLLCYTISVSFLAQ